MCERVRRGQKFSSQRAKTEIPDTDESKRKEGGREEGRKEGLKIKSAGPDSGERERARMMEVRRRSDLRCCDEHSGAAATSKAYAFGSRDRG